MRMKFAPSLRRTLSPGWPLSPRWPPPSPLPPRRRPRPSARPGPRGPRLQEEFIVEITNPSPLALENHPVVIDVAAIRASVAWDFNTYNYALFEEKGGDYTLVVSQADDFDKDRYHDEIVLVRTLPPSSTTRLVCYYSPDRSFPAHDRREGLRPRAWEPNGAEAGWESNLAAFKFVHGRIEFYGKLQAGLILKKLPGPGKPAPGLGHGRPRRRRIGRARRPDPLGRRRPRPLFGAAVPRPALKVLLAGPLRALVKAEYPAVRTASGEVG